MVRINLARTAPVNPPGATPVLTASQVWQGLERKVRYATEFVPVILDCKVTRDEGIEVERVVNFKPGSGQGKEGEPVTEICRLFEPTKIDFERPADGSLVCNTVSNGPSGAEDDLELTYSFQLIYPDISETDTEKIAATREQQVKMSKMAVEGSINTIREMVKAGKIA